MSNAVAWEAIQRATPSGISSPISSLKKKSDEAFSVCDIPERAEQYHLVGFQREEASRVALLFVIVGMGLVEQQRTYERADSVARKIVETIVPVLGPQIVGLLKEVRQQVKPTPFADIVAVLGSVSLGDAQEVMSEYLSELLQDSDRSLAQAAEDALDLIKFSNE